MNEQQLAAVKQALELVHNRGDVGVDEWIATEAALQSIISQDALHKMAEESRTSGLRLDDWDKIGCVNHDCDQCKAREQDNFCDKNCVWTDHHPDCKAVQEPVAKVYRHGKSSNGTPWHGIKWLDEGVNMPDGTLLYATPQPVPVKTYHDGKPWPVAPKPWVGLTNEERSTIESEVLMRGENYPEVLAAIEAKLKEKNT